MSSPTLLIGLGGTGSKIVAKVAQMIPADQKQNISCVIFDTDANDIPLIKKADPTIKIVQTSARMTVGEYLSNDPHAKENWFPVNPPLNAKVLSEGAAQVRSISRLGFEAALQANKMGPLQEAIQELYRVDQSRPDQALRLTIVSSLAGGTGSGLVVPVALYVRRYLQDNFHHNANISRGFFILPEVFYSSVPEDQHGNLQSNAYAAVRELDAFLMKGNKTLPEEYADSVKIELPVPGTDRYQNYDLAPYDFCFLFDAQNANGEKLNDLEQYMDHAANILYAMSIGPVNKRSNSSEDNVLRKIVKEKGRNRYAGAGASRLIYPYADICQLVGLNWASKSISEQWLEYDRRYDQEMQRLLKRKEEGYAVDDVDRRDHYALTLKTDANNGKPFASYIVRMVEGTDPQQPSLPDQYVMRLLEKNQQSVNTNKKLSAASESISESLAGIKYNKKSDNISTICTQLDGVCDEIENYLVVGQTYCDQDAKDLAYSLFEGALNEGRVKEDIYLDTALQVKNTYLPPNAIRYYLILALQRMNALLDETNHLIHEEKCTIEDFKKFALKKVGAPNPSSADPFKKYSPSSKLKWKRQKEEEAYVQKAKSALAQMQNQAENYIQLCAQKVILERGIDYLDNMIRGFESFYEALQSQLKGLESRQKDIYRRYTLAPGMTIRYVAASKPCLEEILVRYPYQGSLISIDSALSQRIVDKVFRYVASTKKPNPSRYFGTLFEDDIIAYYQELAHKKLAGQLDQGIFKAMELEADLLLDDEKRDSLAVLDQYVRDIIENTRGLATPFIEKPSELVATCIDACAFNPEFMPKSGDESHEAKLIREELVAHGGEGDDDIDRNTILFYRAYYGLRANSLSKFAPPYQSETHIRNGGEYYNAYSQLVKSIHPNNPHEQIQEITPHIDKSWHLAAKMPDLDEAQQDIEEYANQAAFFWMLVFDVLDFKTESNGVGVYQLNYGRLGLEQGDLIYDGKNRSSKIHEVLRALALDSLYVETLRQYADKHVKADSIQLLPLEETETYQRLLNMEVPLSSDTLGQENKAYPNGHRLSISVLDIPLILKSSMPSNMLRRQNVLSLLHVSLKELVRYISMFSSPDELAGHLETLMIHEYNLFNQNLSDPSLVYAQAKDPFVLDILEQSANFLDEYKLFELAKEMRHQADTIKRGK